MRAGLWLVLVANVSIAAEPSAGWHRAVGLLQYLEGDYAGALASNDAAELEEQKGLANELVKALTELGTPAAAYVDAAKTLEADIVATKPANDVVPQCRVLVQRIVSEQNLKRSPRAPPELEKGAAVFAAQCVACHGAQGRGDGVAGQGMQPAPANFHDAERMETLTPYKVFNTTTFGITGTPMPAFPALTDAERWNVAFFVMALRQPECANPKPGPSLDAVATTTDVELAASLGADQVACARRVFRKTEETGALAVTRAGIDAARDAAARGDWDSARKGIVDAYLLGLEPIEPTLRARDPHRVDQLEHAFTRARLAAQDKHDDFDAATTEVLGLLVDGNTAPSSFWSVFLAALLILVREGFEAMVVIGALLAVMKKLDAPKEVRVVHAGWISALFVGIAAFVFGQKLLAGANREWLESVVALVAVGLLLYAALWLNARATMSAFMTEMRTKMKDAMGRGSVLGLFTISFTSVGRETVETALFLQGLAGDSLDGVIWGSVAGAVLLTGLVIFVKTVGFKLPMKTLFNASTVLLVATAVMLLGKGLHGLQELDVVPLVPVPFVTVDALGIYADALTLGPQLVLALAPLAWWFFKRSSPRVSAA